MPQFVVQHRHSEQRCPASAGRGSGLLSRLSAANAARHGVTILAEAFLDGRHRLILVVEAPDAGAVQRFLSFMSGCGDLQIMAASPAEETVERGGCNAVPPEIRDKRGG